MYSGIDREVLRIAPKVPKIGQKIPVDPSVIGTCPVIGPVRVQSIASVLEDPLLGWF